jgi:AcrR family transcriptional regulator
VSGGAVEEAAADPRVARTRAHVLAAAGHLLADEGRQGFTVDAVAKRSGVARTTIYRHWPDAADLLFDTLRDMAHTSPDVDTGAVRSDLLAIYRALAAGLTTSLIGRCTTTLLDMTRRDPALRPLHRAFIAERRQPALDAIARGIERGELPPDVDAEAVVDRLAGPVFYRHLVVQDPYAAADVERLVDDVLAAVPTRARRRRPR